MSFLPEHAARPGIARVLREVGLLVDRLGYVDRVAGHEDQVDVEDAEVFLDVFILDGCQDANWLAFIFLGNLFFDWPGTITWLLDDIWIFEALLADLDPVREQAYFSIPALKNGQEEQRDRDQENARDDELDAGEIEPAEAEGSAGEGHRGDPGACQAARDGRFAIHVEHSLGDEMPDDIRHDASDRKPCRKGIQRDNRDDQSDRGSPSADHDTNQRLDEENE